MMGEHYNRALLLFNRDRHEEALGELQRGIAEDGNNPYAHGLLALCLSKLDRYQSALEAAKKSIELAPDAEYGHYVLARVYAERNRFAEARAAIKQAIQIDPEDAHSHGLLARIEFGLDNWQEAVNAADAGLAQDATNDMCLHFRSLALVKLGRAVEAISDQETLLAADPNDSYTHMARGWTLLEQGNVSEAKKHFLEALRLDPTNEDARAGLVNALKAQHLIFGLTLRMLLYLGRFRAWAIWIAAIVFFFGLYQLDKLALKYPEALIPLVLFKAIVFTLMVALVVAQPLFDLVLRLDPDGRRALTPEKTRASNWHAVCLIAAFALALVWFWKGDRQMKTFALATLMLTQLITEIFDATPGWVRQRLTWITLFATALIPASFVITLVALFLILKLKLHVLWMLKLGLVYLPIVSVLISAFAHDIAEWLEKRRPDAAE